MDNFDRKILKQVQSDASLPVEKLADEVGLSRNACWRRVKAMEESGVIKGRVALVDPEKIGLELCAIVLIRTADHDQDWLQKFARAVQDMPEIVDAQRTTGEIDYILRVRLANMKDYDSFYQRLIQRVPLADISASFVMEDLKQTTALPV